MVLRASYKEKGKKLWVTALKVKAAKGDTVEFPDSQPKEWRKDAP
jgi:hypothetical protein